jgi:hypothetical protein
MRRKNNISFFVNRSSQIRELEIAELNETILIYASINVEPDAEGIEGKSPPRLGM